MDITLNKADLKDAVLLHGMQVKAFMPLLQKYLDYETSPANEPLERVLDRLKQPFTDYYIIQIAGLAVGGVRIVRREDHLYRVSPIFILPEYQGKGVAQAVFSLIEQRYPDARVWELDTILQEQGHCYLYEKLGYRRTGEIKEINERITLVFYEKK